MTSDKPNILFSHLDNISLGDFGCYGGYFSTWEGNNRTAGMVRWPSISVQK